MGPAWNCRHPKAPTSWLPVLRNCGAGKLAAWGSSTSSPGSMLTWGAPLAQVASLLASGTIWRRRPNRTGTSITCSKLPDRSKSGSPRPTGSWSITGQSSWNPHPSFACRFPGLVRPTITEAVEATFSTRSAAPHSTGFRNRSWNDSRGWKWINSCLAHRQRRHWSAAFRLQNRGPSCSASIFQRPLHLTRSCSLKTAKNNCASHIYGSGSLRIVLAGSG
jgi:hypothetical protein